MRGHHCEKDAGTKVAAFTNYLQSNENQETSNLSTENVELLTKFATFLQEQKREKLMHEHGHGKFAKHGPHGMLRHHFGRHGPYGKHGHGPHGPHGMVGHHIGRHGPFGKHGHGHHGHHGHHDHHGHHGHHGKHGFEIEKHGKHGKMDKHFWKCIALYNIANPDKPIVIEDDDCIASGRNQSSPQEDSTPANVVEVPSTSKGVCKRRGRHCGKDWVIVPRAAETQAPEQSTIQPEAAPRTDVQENLAEMVENINIENTPEKE